MGRFAVHTIAAAILMGSTGAGATIINLDALDSQGVVRNLAAGTYDIAVVGIAGGGAYDAWNAWNSVSGCDTQGENCSTGFLVSYAVDLGVGGVFNQTNGFHVLPSVRNIFATAGGALAAFNSRQLMQCNFGFPCGMLAGFTSSFTLAAAQDVNFLILDTPYFDNGGGVSIELTRRTVGAIPEPETWGLMIAGFGMAGAMLRRRRALAV